MVEAGEVVAMSVTDHTREADSLFELLFAHQIVPAYDGNLSHHRCHGCWVSTNGGPNSPDNVRHVRDTILGSDWLAARDAALVEGRDAENTRLREALTDMQSWGDGWMQAAKTYADDMDASRTERDEARAALAEAHTEAATQHALRVEAEELARQADRDRETALAVERERIATGIEAMKPPVIATAYTHGSHDACEGALRIVRSSTDGGDIDG